MIVSLDEVKNWLRDIPVEDEGTVTMLIGAAERFIKNATGNNFDSTNELAKLLCLILVTDWYENREMIGKVSEKVRFSVESAMAQLAYCYDTVPPSVPVGLTGGIGDSLVDLSWSANTELDLEGYHVYQDSVKITTTPISETSYQVINLVNGTTYSFQVSAIDTSGNESKLTEAIKLTPSVT